MPYRLLIIEDDGEVARKILACLLSEGYILDTATSVEAAKKILALNSFDLVILDLGIPLRLVDHFDHFRSNENEKNGFEVAAWLRDSQQNVRLIYLTDRDELENQIRGFDSGGDHYITKPFDETMLRAVVRSTIRRLDGKFTQKLDVFRGWQYDRAERQITNFLHPSMRPIPITHSESKILNELLDANGTIVAKEILSKVGFGRPLNPGDRAVDTAIAKLRLKFGDEADSNSPIIQTIYGSGYRLRK